MARPDPPGFLCPETVHIKSHICNVERQSNRKKKVENFPFAVDRMHKIDYNYIRLRLKRRSKMKKETAQMIEKLVAENKSRLFDLYANAVSGDTETMQSWITDPTVVDMWIAKAEDQDTTVEALIDAELVEAEQQEKGYHVQFAGGYTAVTKSETLRGAKVEATKTCGVGYEMVYISDTMWSDPICIKYENIGKWTDC